MLNSFRTGLLALNLLTGGPTFVSAAQSTPPAATNTVTATAAEPRVTAANEDSEIDRGWVGFLPLLGAATVMVTAITVGVSFMRRKR